MFFFSPKLFTPQQTMLFWFSVASVLVLSIAALAMFGEAVIDAAISGVKVVVAKLDA